MSEPVPIPVARPEMMKEIIDKIGERRDAAFARKKKLIPRLMITAFLLFVCIFLPIESIYIAMWPTLFLFFLVLRAGDVESARIEECHKAIDYIMDGWRLDLDSILALADSMMPAVEPDREINNE